MDTYDECGAAKYLPSDQKAGQEDVVRKWLEGQGGCLLTHNNIFTGMEAATSILISMGANEPGLRSGLLRGVGRVALIANTAGGYGHPYKADLLASYFHLLTL